jgi:hypothetical protein
MMKQNKKVHMVTFILLVLGGLNWLLVGIMDFNLISTILGGDMSILTRIVYILVGLSTVYELVTHMHGCKACEKCAPTSSENAPPPGM